MARSEEVEKTVTLTTRCGQNIKVGVVRERIQIVRPRGNRVYVKAYDGRMIQYLRATIKEDLLDGEDFIIKITGPRRKAKSTAAIQIARSIGCLNLDNIVFSAKDFAEQALSLPESHPERDEYSQIIFDEAGYGMFSQQWYQRQQQELIRLLEVNAAKRMIVYLVSPHNDFLNAALRGTSMVKLWLDVGLSKTYGKGWASLWDAIYSQWHNRGYWKPLCALYIDPITDDFWRDYEIKKRAFIASAGKRTAKAS